jgi:hypothetical protein
MDIDIINTKEPHLSKAINDMTKREPYSQLILRVLQ